jgi:hypothetical protein
LHYNSNDIEPNKIRASYNVTRTSPYEESTSIREFEFIEIHSYKKYNNVPVRLCSPYPSK